MATVQTAIINPALRMLGQLSSGASPTSAESSDALIALNAMIEGWKNDGLMAYALQEESLTITASTETFTVGPSGTLTTTRPVAIEAAWIVDSNTSYPVQIITHKQYAAISSKTSTSSWPDRIAYEATMVNGTIYVWPLANASRTLKLLTRVPVSEFAATSTSVSLPPGWEEALAANLAVRLAPEFETEASPTVMGLARNSKRAIKNANSRPIHASNELAMLFSGGITRNIEADGQ